MITMLKKTREKNTFEQDTKTKKTSATRDVFFLPGNYKTIIMYEMR